MKKFLPLIGVIGLILVAALVWWVARPFPAKGRSSTSSRDGLTPTQAGPENGPQASLPVAAQLDKFRGRLAASRDPAANRLVLADLRKLLASLPAAVASREIQLYLASAGDAATQLDVTVEAGGGLADASSLRVFLLDYLGRVDRTAAGAVAVQILSQYTTPDEWAVSLRNYGWANPGAGGQVFLQEKARALLSNPAWLRDPSAGFLEAFDAIVYAHGTSLFPELASLVGGTDNRAAAHAAFLTLDRLTIAEPAAMLGQLVGQPGLMSGHEKTRAGLVARADVGEPAQRTLVEQYLLDPSRDPVELATFAGLYPNANFMVSNNLLTTSQTPKGADLSAHDREALLVIEQWQNDPRFERLQPLLARMHERLEIFVRQAAGGSP